MSDMVKTLVALSVAAMSLTLASAACAQSSCEETAATNYAIAIAIDAPDADMVVEDTMADCSSPVESLNDVIAIDGEAWLPVCQFEGDCQARQMLAPVLALLAK